MIGYYPPREDGELLYSSTSRAAALLYSGKNVRIVADRMLGSQDFAFGCDFPNRAHRLIEHAPPLARLDENSVIDGSMYHLVAPFLSPDDRGKLERSMFDGSAIGMRRWFGRSSRRLRYCVLCARRDADAKRSAIWRVLPNHPSVTCCDEHRIRLTEAQVSYESYSLHDPEAFIDLTVSVPERASMEEIVVARDARWLYEQKSKHLPGFQAIAAELRARVLQGTAFSRGHVHVDGARLRSALLERMPVAVAQLDPEIAKISEYTIIGGSERLSLHRYSLLAQLLGVDLRTVFERVASGYNAGRSTTPIFPVRHTEEVIAKSKRQLAESLAEHPSMGRKELGKLCPQATAIVRSKDRTGYEEIMPERRGRGRNSDFDWSAKDERLHQQIVALIPALGDDAQSVTRILVRAGLTSNTIVKPRGKLPLTRALVLAIREDWWKRRAERMAKNAA